MLIWLIDNRTSCRPIPLSVIILVIKQIGRPILLITRMITDRIGLHSVLLPLLNVFFEREVLVFKIDNKKVPQYHRISCKNVK